MRVGYQNDTLRPHHLLSLQAELFVYRVKKDPTPFFSQALQGCDARRVN